MKLASPAPLAALLATQQTSVPITARVPSPLRLNLLNPPDIECCETSTNCTTILLPDPNQKHCCGHVTPTSVLKMHSDKAMEKENKHRKIKQIQNRKTEGWGGNKTQQPSFTSQTIQTSVAPPLPLQQGNNLIRQGYS
ncbi:hypothetical protein Btru_030821 [Bulinus truncatus]|nr:hypothetical protein Btru_030821 [Bulinus truncatus]